MAGMDGTGRTDRVRARARRRMWGIGVVMLAVTVAGLAQWGGIDTGRSIALPGGATLAFSAAPVGLVVTSLRTGGAAAAAGLRVGDVIDRVDGRRASPPALLASMVVERRAVLHVAPRGDAAARTLIVRAQEGGPT